MKHQSSPIRIDDEYDNTVSVTIPSGLYSKETVLKACYKYMDLVFLKVACTKNSFSIEMKSKDNNMPVRMLADQLCNELIDFELRTIIAEQTKEVRSALMERAFLS